MGTLKTNAAPRLKAQAGPVSPCSSPDQRPRRPPVHLGTCHRPVQGGHVQHTCDDIHLQVLIPLSQKVNGVFERQRVEQDGCHVLELDARLHWGAARRACMGSRLSCATHATTASI